MVKTNPLAKEKKLVIKLLQDCILATVHFSAGLSETEAEVIRWRLPKKINPNAINQDLEILTTSLANMVDFYGLEGLTATLILPHNTCPIKVIEIPMNLNNRSEKKEFDTLTKASALDFWKEYDPDLATMKQAEIRSHTIAVNAEDNVSKILYSAVATQNIKEFTAWLLGGGLYPVSFIPDDIALTRTVESRLSRVERERPFCIFNLSYGNNRLIYVSTELIFVAQINIDELDEVLLDDIPALDETDNAFWAEVFERLSASLKQGMFFLNQEINLPKFDTVFFTTDRVGEETLFELFRNNFRLANFRNINDQFKNLPFQASQAAADATKSETTATPPFYSTQYLSNIGCYPMTYYSIPSIENPIIQAPLMNLHPNSKFIESNFSLRPKFNQLLKITGSLSLVLLALILVLFFTVDLGNDKLEEREKLSTKIADLDKKIRQEITLVKNLQEKYNFLADKTDRDKKNYFFTLFNQQLPMDAELDYVAISGKKIRLKGHANYIASVNQFYENFFQGPKFINAKIEAYQRADSALHFFEISAEINY